MRVVLFVHSLLSDWNHGNAHFLRGVVTELQSRGVEVAAYEPADAWSYANQLQEGGEDALDGLRQVYPNLASTRYDPAGLDLESALDGADLVLVHEWTDPALVHRLGQHRAAHDGYRLLFHDTHHRAVTAPSQMAAFDLAQFDGALVFGEAIRQVYLQRDWAKRVWTWHEAADVRLFHPREADQRGDLVWIGNWGDDERTAELREFLLGPVRSLGLRAHVHGVRYPDQALRDLADAGVDYGGWLPNYRVPELFAAYRVTVHVPRRPYATALPGIPTIRVFEALACGIPLVSAPWEDREGLFTPGKDYLVAEDGREMRELLQAVLGDLTLASRLRSHGHQTILARHTCAHRVDELMTIYEEVA